jgi:hypothetical protein
MKRRLNKIRNKKREYMTTELAEIKTREHPTNLYAPTKLDSIYYHSGTTLSY